MDDSKFKVVPMGWTKKNAVTTLRGSLEANNLFTRDYKFNFEISYYENEILSVTWDDSGDSIARQSALNWLDSIKHHLPEYLVY